MSAIERCRTAALGGHVTRCESCEHTEVSYNSCRNRHCPKCQGAAAKQWLAARETELLPVSYFHVVFTVPTQIGDIAYQNKALLYDLLFKVSAETLLTIGADPKHLGARLGLIGVLHTWGSAMTHHPHLHFIVPGGGLSLDGNAWITSRPDFLVHVKVLSALFRRLFLDKLLQLYAEQRLCFFGKLKSFIILVPSNASSLAFVTESGMSMSERRSQGPLPCSNIYPVTPTGSLSLTLVSSASMNTTLPLNGKTTGQSRKIATKP